MTIPVVGAFAAAGASVSLEWNPSSSTNVVGYTIFYGVASHQYTFSLDAGTNTTITVSGLENGQTYYFATIAYDPEGGDSPYSNELIDSVPVSPAPVTPIIPATWPSPTPPPIPVAPTAPTAPTPPIAPVAPAAPTAPPPSLEPTLPSSPASSMERTRSEGQLSPKAALMTTAVMGDDFGAVPLAAFSGVYNGLFYRTATDGVSVMEEATTGFLGNCVIETNGFYSARLACAGRFYSFSGAFNADGDTTAVVSRLDAGLGNLSVALHLGEAVGIGRMTGVVSNMDAAAPWVAQLTASLATNAFPLAAKFLGFSPLQADPFGDASDNFRCKLTVAANGVVTLFGRLGDGALFSQTVAIAGDGSFPIYVSFYQGGFLAGWLNPGASIGNLTWIHPSILSPPRLNQEGFTHAVRFVTTPDFSATSLRPSQ